MSDYVATIGIECHVQLRTKSKLFSGANNDAREAAPNTTVSPLCFGLPGTLPVLNREAVALAIRAGVALHAEIARTSSFDRKHYFYPDLPKGYQITQLARPLVGKGEVVVPMGDKELRVGIRRAHLEEDAGKLVHPAGADYSLVDLNRAGTPLLEIVSEPDMHSAAEAKAYVQELYLLMKSAGVTDGNLYYGNMRFDVNVSVAKAGELGTRTETKNLNSFRSVERAVLFEVERQTKLLEKGEQILQETRGWNEAKQQTTSQRSKEEAQDYRYMPEPDVPPIELTEAEIVTATAYVTPRLPEAIRGRLTGIGIPARAAETLLLADVTTGLAYVSTILEIAERSGKDGALFAANFLANRDIARREQVGETAGLPSVGQFMAVYGMYGKRELSSNNADNLLFGLRSDPGQDARAMAEKQGLLQENDSAALGAAIDAVLADSASQKAVADVKAGEHKAIGYLVGQVMKHSGGKANPGLVSELIRQKLGL